MRALLLSTVLLAACAVPPEPPGAVDDDTTVADTDLVDTDVADTTPPDDTDTLVDTDTPDTDDDTTVPDVDPCPDGVVCVDSFPFAASGSTTGAARDFDAYACAPTTDESGPEIVYRLAVPEAGFLAVDLPWVESGADVDVHLLASDDAGDCLDRGHWRAGTLVDAGEYWLVVDTWVDSGGDEKDGDYEVTVGFTSEPFLHAQGMSAQAAADALTVFDRAWKNGDTDRFEYAVSDFSLPSSEPREWVLDLAQGDVLWELFVAHGEGSSDPDDDRLAVEFSNVDGSHQSSLGLMRAGEVYTGSYGYSMRLDGLEDGYDDAVRSRAIVVHPWEGSRQEYVDDWGETAPTWGCPAIDDRLAADVIDTLSDGALLLYWYPDGDWSRNSAYLR